MAKPLTEEQRKKRRNEYDAVRREAAIRVLRKTFFYPEMTMSGLDIISTIAGGVPCKTRTSADIAYQLVCLGCLVVEESAAQWVDAKFSWYPRAANQVLDL